VEVVVGKMYFVLESSCIRCCVSCCLTNGIVHGYL